MTEQTVSFSFAHEAIATHRAGFRIIEVGRCALRWIERNPLWSLEHGITTGTDAHLAWQSRASISSGMSRPAKYAVSRDSRGVCAFIALRADEPRPKERKSALRAPSRWPVAHSQCSLHRRDLTCISRSIFGNPNAQVGCRCGLGCTSTRLVRAALTRSCAAPPWLTTASRTKARLVGASPEDGHRALMSSLLKSGQYGRSRVRSVFRAGGRDV